MKYFSNITNMTVIDKIVTSSDRSETNTIRAANSLICNYRPRDGFSVTGKGYQDPHKSARPDFTIEKHIDGEIVPHGIMDVKGQGSKIGFETILDKIAVGIEDIPEHLDVNFSIFAIVIKGATIGFYIWRNNPELFDHWGIPHFKGFVPLTYEMKGDQWRGAITKDEHNFAGFVQHVSNRANLEGRREILESWGVEKTVRFNYPHKYDLRNPDQQEHLHQLFTFIFSNDSQ